MTPFIIITDSAADLSAQQVCELQVEVLPLTFTMDGVTRNDWPDRREMAIKDFYNKLRNGISTTTSAVNTGQYLNAMAPHLHRGKDVLVLTLSSALSATYQSAVIAAEDMAEQFPDRKIYVVDTLSAAGGEALLVWKAAQMCQAGTSIDEVRDWVQDYRTKTCHWFTVNDLNHLKRGGRITAASALVGTMFQVKPVIHVDNEGRLINVEKARGRTAALQSLSKHYQDTVSSSLEIVIIAHGDALEDAEKTAQMLRDTCGSTKIIINDIGPVIGAHTGPGIVGVFFLGRER